MKIVAYTLMWNRLFYTKRMVESLQNSVGDYDYQHLFFDQGSKDDSAGWIEGLKDSRYKVIRFKVNTGLSYGVRHGIWEAQKLDADVILKIDNDVYIHSKNLFNHALALLRITKNVGFLSPSTIGYKEDIPTLNRTVVYSKKMDWYYILRQVDRLRGNCRFMPTKVLKQIELPYGNESKMLEGMWFNLQMNKKNLPMFVSENGMVVEHQEGSSGQIVRFPIMHTSKETPYIL